MELKLKEETNKTMSILADLDKVTDSKYLRIFFALLLLITPGVLTVFFYFNDFFVNGSTFKIILLALTIFTPAIVIPLLSIASARTDADLEGEEELFSIFFLAIFVASLSVYGALVISYFREYTFPGFLLSEIIISVLGSILVYRIEKAEQKQQQKSKI